MQVDYESTACMTANNLRRALKSCRLKAGLPLFLSSRRSTCSDGRAFPSLPLYVLLLRP